MIPTPRTSAIWGGYLSTHPYVAGAVEETAMIERENAALRSLLAQEHVNNPDFHGHCSETLANDLVTAALKDELRRMNGP